MSNFQSILSQIENFIKKFYKNEMLKGAFLFLSTLLLSFLLISFLEYIGRFSPQVRAVFFFTFVGVNLGIFLKYILWPSLKLFKISKRLTLKDASKMIGKIFPDISDKLQNTLQLNDQLNLSSSNANLIQASIDQKASEFSAVPFSNGIVLSENKRYLKYFLPIVAFILLTLIFLPSVFNDGSKRFINYDKEFVQLAPFKYSILSNDTLIQGNDYILKVKLTGTDFPNEVKINSTNGVYNLKKISPIEFEYHFSNVDNHIDFTFLANGFVSDRKRVFVIKKPVIDQIDIKISYPKHTGKTAESLKDLSDMSIPEGSSIDWEFQSINTNNIDLLVNDSLVNSINKNLSFIFNTKHFNSTINKFYIGTDDYNKVDSLSCQISVIKDTYPTISLNIVEDSSNALLHFFNGVIGDDYGFSSLNCIVKIQKKDSLISEKFKVRINPSISKQNFSYVIDFSRFNLKPGDELSYYFRVTDNDAVNDFKSSISTKNHINIPELNELEDLLSDQNDKLKKDMDEALKEALEIKKEVSEIKIDLINKTEPDWKDQQKLQNMLNDQKSLENKLNELKKEFDTNKNQESDLLEMSEELREKQALLEELMKELMDDEMKELMEELQKLMDEMDKDKLLDNMEKMEQKSESLEEELDRTLELFKHLELEKKVENIEEQLRVLAEKQDDLKEKTENKDLSDEDLKKKQDELNKDFEKIKEDIKEAEELNKELEEPEDISFEKEKEQAIEEEMEKASESLSESKEKKASESQSKAAKMMEEMADDVAAMMDSASSNKEEEDMEQLRFLLENIITLSHSEEDLMLEFIEIDRQNPVIVDLNREQLKINNATQIVKDSLLSLAKRHAQISNTVISEINDLEYNLGKAKDLGEERNLKKTIIHQQYAVTSYNNLALLLSDILEQMQKAAQMQSQMKGKGSCNNPGGSGKGGKPSSKMSMQQMKDQMKKQLGQMKNGSKPGGKDGKKPGEGLGQGGISGGKIPGLSSKEIAKMALEQGEMRRQLQQLRQELNKDGSGSGNELSDLINELEKLENDLLNNGFTNDLLKRQQEIMTRLLESEKAILERGYSEERESKSAKVEEEGNQINFLEYNKLKENEIELLRSVPLGLKVYYKNMINSYFNNVNN